MASSISNGDNARLMSSASGTAAAATSPPPPPPPPPPALAASGPCGVSEPIHGTVEASNTGDLLKTTLVLPTRDNVSALPFSLSLPPLFDSFGGAAATLAAAAARCAPPYPLVAFFSGFQARASSYDSYARHLASWAYAVVRYDARFLSITPDNRELGWLADVVTWAVRAAPAGALSSAASQQQPDILFTGGHSRGAKLAALQFAGSLEFARCGSGSGGANNNNNFLPKQPLPVSSAFLIDPVDNTRFTPASEAYPSAAAALRAQGADASLAIAAAGRIGACNPLESGFNSFWPGAVGGSSSFLLVFKGAGHATFSDGGRLANKLADWLCGGGDLARETAIHDTAAAMVSWFDSFVSAKVRGARAQAAGDGEESENGGDGAVSVSLDSSREEVEGEERVRVMIAKKKRPAPRDAAVPSPSAAALQENFLAWTRAAAAAGQVEFEVRGGVVPPQPAPQPAPCPAAAAAATANNVVPFPLAAKKEESVAP